MLKPELSCQNVNFRQITTKQNVALPLCHCTTLAVIDGWGQRGKNKDKKDTIFRIHYLFCLVPCWGFSLLFCQGIPTPGHRAVKTGRLQQLRREDNKDTWMRQKRKLGNVNSRWWLDYQGVQIKISDDLSQMVRLAVETDYKRKHCTTARCEKWKPF